MNSLQESAYGYTLVDGQMERRRQIIDSIYCPPHLAVYRDAESRAILAPQPSRRRPLSELSIPEEMAPPPPTVPPPNRAPELFASNGAATMDGRAADRLAQQLDQLKQPDRWPSGATPGWDVFRTLPPPPDELQQSRCVAISLRLLKALVLCVLALFVLLAAVVAKLAFVLMAAVVRQTGENVTACYDRQIDGTYAATVSLTPALSVKWMWALFTALCIPELGRFLQSFHRILSRNVQRPTTAEFFAVLIPESLHTIGVGVFVFHFLSRLPSETALLLSNGVCLTPALLALLSRKANRTLPVLLVFDLLAIAGQSSAFWVDGVAAADDGARYWLLAPTLALVSLAWWPNFLHADAALPCVRALSRFASRLTAKRSKTYVLVSPVKIVLYLVMLVVLSRDRFTFDQLSGANPFTQTSVLVASRGVDQATLDELIQDLQTAADESPDYGSYENYDYYEEDFDDDEDAIVIDAEGSSKRRRRRDAVDVGFRTVYAAASDVRAVVVLQALAVFLSYQGGKYACKLRLQQVDLALPLTLSVPVSAVVLRYLRSLRAADACYLADLFPIGAFGDQPSSEGSPFDYSNSTLIYVWLLWLASQVWITVYLWRPRAEKLASGERLFIAAPVCSAFVDQSLALSRRRDDTARVRIEDVDLDFDDAVGYETVRGASSLPSSGSSKAREGAADAITKIFACATMWHETPREMLCMLKSLFRLDEDQSARRNAQKYLKVVDPDYYEMDAHIFFDDAFELNGYGEAVMNSFVKQLVDKIDEAASAVHQTDMKLKAPKKVSTPYGGRLTWILPGRNRLVIHLKNKAQIQHRKRWSQVMYLYYLLGFGLMQKVEDEQRKESISENTFILTLDGDVDFKPSCVQLLVDLMKKNRKLGAACGRIHPRGSGIMLWYQKFEYAVGHWLQKATEHMLGCVLCAPGCFSLFRACALMDDNVARRYASRSETAKDYIQHDQGEDRWLCTLLLQRGYRVEYCAAADALTFAPEGFGEFFNQRRRWIPSTLANVIDLLVDYRRVVRANDSISLIYVFYQFIMLLSSILGPGTVFLMVVGAVSVSFGIGTALSFVVVATPVIVFSTVCLTCSTDKQILAAQIIGALFAMLMTSVIVGTALQIKKDGIYSPHAIFLFAVIASFVLSAVLHPLEFTCVIPGLVYFMAIPCMYMLLPIYSVCNLNVVSWGTREYPLATNSQVLGERQSRLSPSGDSFDTAEQAHYTVGCGSLCTLMCCLKSGFDGAGQQYREITEQLRLLHRKIDETKLTHNGQCETIGCAAEATANECESPADRLDESIELSTPNDAYRAQYDEQMADAWLGDTRLCRAEREALDNDEVAFWKDLVDKYLQPVRLSHADTQKMNVALTDLRNRVAYVFFMLNALVIVIVFLLQLKKDCLHVEWPFGPRVNHSIVPCDADTTKDVWVYSRLQLEPIGLVFLIFFMSILVVQFGGMLLHRLATLAHIVASTELRCGTSPRRRLSADELVVQNAVEIARELQAIRGVDGASDGADEPAERAISRRRVVRSLENSRRSQSRRRTGTLDAAFKKRFFALDSADDDDGGGDEAGAALGGREHRLTLRKDTIRALKHRRSATHTARRRSTFVFSDAIYGTLDQPKTAASDESESLPSNDSAAAAATARGPAQRRLERLFNEQADKPTPPPRALPSTHATDAMPPASTSSSDSAGALIDRRSRTSKPEHL